jgi:hypothetical protein
VENGGVIKFRAEQAIYTRLEGVYSPTGQSGYQLAFAPRGLGARLRGKLEDLLPGFRPRTPEAVRFQFAALDDDVFMVSHTSVPEIDQESIGIADRSGQAPLAHAILIDRREMLSIDFNPFRVIDAVSWLANFRLLIDQFRDLAGEAPPVIVEASDRCEEPPEDASDAEVAEIKRLAASAREWRSLGETLDVEGSPSEASDWFRLLFHHASPEDAEFCSFTTSFDSYDQPRGRFWAVGRQRAGLGTSVRYYLAEKRLVVLKP